MNYSEMSDFEINKAVLEVLSDFPVHPVPRNGSSAAGTQIATHSVLHWFDYCNSWDDAGLIIEAYKISINAHGKHAWMAWRNTGNTLEEISSNRHQFSVMNEKPLRAVMECFLMMHEAVYA